MKKILIYLMLSILLCTVTLALPGDWWGNVKIDGNNASSGTLIQGRINNITVDTAYVGEFLADYYMLHLDGYSGATVSFMVWDIISNYTTVWSVGNHPQVDLDVLTLTDGSVCNYDQSCSGTYCVNNFCRSSSTYCGDAVCDSGESCGSCSSDCGSCGGGGGGSSSYTSSPIIGWPTQACLPIWDCKEWGSCQQNGTMNRECNDISGCNSTIEAKTSMGCVYINDSLKVDYSLVADSFFDKEEVKALLYDDLKNLESENLFEEVKEVNYKKEVINNTKEERKESKDKFELLKKYDLLSCEIIKEIKTISIKGKTKTYYTLTPSKDCESHYILEEIPKSIASSASQIGFNPSPEILEDDPLVLWSFEGGDKKTVAYSVDGNHIEKNTQTYSVTTKEKENKLILYFQQGYEFIKIYFNYLLIALVISILGAGIVVAKNRNIFKGKRFIKINQPETYENSKDQLKTYVKDQIKIKHQLVLIEELRNAGWEDNEIMDAFSKIKT